MSKIKPVSFGSSTSRRQLLKSVAGMLTGLGGSSLGGQHISSATPTIPQDMATQPSPASNERWAYVTLPGLTAVTLLANIAYLTNISSGPQPIIYMDIHDYHRIQNWASERNDETWIRDGALAYGQMVDRGPIQLLNYKQIYTKDIKQKNINRNKTLIEQVPDHIHQDAAKQAAKKWMEYGRGNFQKNHRIQMGETPDKFEASQRLDEKRKRKLERGGGSPKSWNERVINQYVTALTVRKEVDDNINLKLQHVLGEGETIILTKILDYAKNRNIATRHIEDLEPFKHIWDLSYMNLSPTREALDQIGDVATKMEKVQRNDFILSGLPLVTPQYNNLFDMVEIQRDLGGNPDIKGLAKKATSILDTLERRTNNSPTSDKIKLDYAAEKIAEDTIQPNDPLQNRNLKATTGHAATFSQYSNELDSLIYDGGVSRPAALVAASVVSDPFMQKDEDGVFRRTKSIVHHFNPPSKTMPQLMAFRRRKEAWTNERDWYWRLSDNT